MPLPQNYDTAMAVTDFHHGDKNESIETRQDLPETRSVTIDQHQAVAGRNKPQLRHHQQIENA